MLLRFVVVVLGQALPQSILSVRCSRCALKRKTFRAHLSAPVVFQLSLPEDFPALFDGNKKV